MRPVFLPIFIAPCVISNNRTSFHTTNGSTVVSAPGALVRQLIKLCDGIRTLDDVVRLLEKRWDGETVRDFVESLCENKIVTDSRYQSDGIWQAVRNPSCFLPPIPAKDSQLLEERAIQRERDQPVDSVHHASSSAFNALVGTRASLRIFSGRSVAHQAIVDLAWCAYGEVAVLPNANPDAPRHRRTIPSAGALYPLVVHIVLLQDSDELEAGIYRTVAVSPTSVGFTLVSSDTSGVVRAFADPLMLDKAHGAVIVSGSFHETGHKYGNRSMLYVPLEAGHAAQNVLLSATESGVAAVEVGGFVEQLLGESVGLVDGYQPLTTVVFGDPGKPCALKDPAIEVDWVMPISGNFRLPFVAAYARMAGSTGADDWSSGKALSPRLAYTKAVAEAREWNACEHVPKGLLRARFVDINDHAVDPRGIVHYHPVQYRMRGFPLKRFDETAFYEWVAGTNEFRSSAVEVLADCVYIGYSPPSGAPAYTRTSTSGTAAHPVRVRAVESGTLELIERDSFMIAYLSRLPFPTIWEKTLPDAIQKRVGHLKEHGFKVWVKDYSTDLAPVVFIFVQNQELSYTMCASACDFNMEKALDHALMEIESAVLIRLSNGPLPFIAPTALRTPEHHGALYEQKRYFRKADFLIGGDKFVTFRNAGRGTATSWQSLLDLIEAKGMALITVTLAVDRSSDEIGDLHVTRSIVPGLVPMSFGYRQEPFGMARLRSVAKELFGRVVAYGDMTKFPHPFT